MAASLPVVNPCHPDASPDGPPPDPPPDPPPESIEGNATAIAGLQLPRRSAIDWDRTRLTPGFVRALAKAQADAQTVGKSSTIEARAGTAARKYAGADAMIEEATRVLAPNGIAWICASTSAEPVEPRFVAESGDKQWVCSRVHTDSVLMHSGDDGDDGVGLLVTSGETCSIGRLGTPIDKADKAAETYLRLYIARDLLGLDRGDAADDVNDRDDADSGRGGSRSPGVSAPQALAASRRKAEAHWKPLSKMLAARDGKSPEAAAWAEEAVGPPEESLEYYTRLDDAISAAIEEVRGKSR